MEFPVTFDLKIGALYAKLAKIEASRISLCEDLMTEAYGAPVDDFMEDYDRKERKTLGEIAHRAKEVNDQRATDFTNIAFEKWMP